jgi:hypothetical protein
VVGGEAAGAGPLPGQAAGPGATAPPRGQQREGNSINNIRRFWAVLRTGAESRN